MKRVLSIDGGGIRGIIPALICKFIEEDLLEGERLSSLFDLIVGTSTGGILALGIVCDTIDRTSRLVDFYESKGPSIFSFPGNSAAQMFWPKYTNKRLEAALTEVFGPIGFNQAIKPVLVTAYDTQLRRPKVFDSSKQEYLNMVQVALATSAAPTYFPPFKIHNEVFIDGGIVANNPSNLAHAHAKMLWPSEEVLLLSLGTGNLSRPLLAREIHNWGKLGWARPVIDCFMDGSSQITHSCLQTTHQKNYLRLQGGLNEFTEPMDGASRKSIFGMKAIAGNVIDQNRSSIRAFVDCLVEAGRPLTMTITTPVSGSTVQHGPLLVKGIINNYRGEKIYAFTGMPGRYWPSERIVPSGADWSANLNVGTQENEALVTVAEVSDELASYIEFYRSVARLHNYCGVSLEGLSSRLASVRVRMQQ